MYTAEQIANFFIYLSKDDPDSDMTNMRLNKLLYIAQMYYMHSHNGEPLFSDNMEAWEHGPVVYDTYKKYQSYKNNKIEYLDPDYDEDEIDDDTSDFLIELYISTNKYSTSYLREISHFYNGAWRRIYNGENRTFLPKGAIEKDYDYISSKIGDFSIKESVKKIPHYETYKDDNGHLVVVR